MFRNFEYTQAYRQGECLFFKVKNGSIEGRRTLGGKLVPSGVIRIGEKGDHEHKLVGSATLSLFPESDKSEGQPTEGFIKVDGEAKVTHPEHKSIKLPKGEYIVKTQKEATGKHTHTSVKD